MRRVRSRDLYQMFMEYPDGVTLQTLARLTYYPERPIVRDAEIKKMMRHLRLFQALGCAVGPTAMDMSKIGLLRARRSVWFPITEAP